MPELPEVETMRRILSPQMMGRKIMAVEIRNPQVIAHPAPEAFAQALQDQIISDMGRRGKFLWLSFPEGDREVFHLRMTGLPLVTPPDYPIEKHTHLILRLDDGNEFRYIDPRRFGRFWYIRKDEADSFTGMEQLGPEPDDPILTGDWLKSRLGRRKKSVKEMLHDQSVIAGIGNIYSDEILFDARIHPERLCADLSDEDWQQLSVSIPKVIRWGIEIEDMTPEEYLAGQGKEYRNAEHLRAYGRAGAPCVRCGAIMNRITVGGRSSCFCSQCQKA